MRLLYGVYMNYTQFSPNSKLHVAAGQNECILCYKRNAFTSKDLPIPVYSGIMENIDI